MEIKALKAFTIRDSETGNLSSIAHGAIAEVSSALGESLIADGLAEKVVVDASFKALVEDTITAVTSDMLDGVKKINEYAFYECVLLKSVEIPSSVTRICSRAFSSCRSLESITISNSVTEIQTQVFYACPFKSITIPSSVSSIGMYCFDSCTQLENVTVKRTTPPTLGSEAFSNNSRNLVIYVPSESVDTYKAASGWSTYADKIQAIPNE